MNGEKPHAMRWNEHKRALPSVHELTTMSLLKVLGPAPLLTPQIRNLSGAPG